MIFEYYGFTWMSAMVACSYTQLRSYLYLGRRHDETNLLDLLKLNLTPSVLLIVNI